MRTDGKMPEEHPLAYRSVLWSHLLKIADLVEARNTWKEITRVLNEEHGVSVKQGTVINFYNRYASRKRPLPRSIQILIEKQRPKPVQRFTRPVASEKPKWELTPTND